MNSIRLNRNRAGQLIFYDTLLKQLLLSTIICYHVDMRTLYIHIYTTHIEL